MSRHRYESEEDILPYTNLRWAWIAASAVVTLFVLGFVLFPPVFSPPAKAASSAVLFLGRFHPIALHMPVGLICLAMFVELLCLRRSFELRWGEAALFVSVLLGASATVAVILGSMLGRDDFDGGAYKLHTFFGMLVGLGCVTAMFARLTSMQQRLKGQLSNSKFLMQAYQFVLFSTFGTMSIGAHFGANMVHGDDYLLKYAPTGMASSVRGAEGWLLSFVTPKKKSEAHPAAVVKVTPPVPTPQPVAVEPTPAQKEPVAVVAPPSPPVAAKLAFNDVILPLLQSKCNSCHSDQKSKGKLKMHTYEDLMKGGGDGPTTIVAGKPEDSLAIVRLKLPEDDDEHMPPAEKTQFTKEESALLEWWIKAGASSTQDIAAIPSELKATADSLMKGQ
jgi:hypothetical protein